MAGSFQSNAFQNSGFSSIAVYSEAITTAAQAVPSLDDRLTLVEAASALLTAGVSLADVVQMVEVVSAAGTGTASVSEIYTGVASYTEAILTTATVGASVIDAIMTGMEQYLFIETARKRSFFESAGYRYRNEFAVLRSYREQARLPA